MIVDLIKFVAESEGKISNAVLNCTKYLFALLLSIKLYAWFMGPWRTGDMTEWEVWREWIVTGKVLVSLFLFCVAYFFLFQFLSSLSVSFLVWFERKNGRVIKLPADSGKAVTKVLDVFGLLSVDKRSGRVSGTRHTKKLIDFLRDINTVEDIEGAEEDYSGFQDIWVLYVTFVFYFLLTGLFRNVGLSALVGVFLIGMPCLYRFIRWFYHKLTEHASELLFIVEGVDLDREIELALGRQGCPVSVKETAENNGPKRAFCYKGKEYALVHHRVDGVFTTTLFLSFVKGNLGEGVSCVLFTNSKLEEGVPEMVMEYGERLTVMIFQKSEELHPLLQRCFPRPFPKNVVF